MNKIFSLGYFLLLNVVAIMCAHARSPYRPIDPKDPMITVYWQDDPLIKYEFHESHLQEAMFKLFNKEYLLKRLLPQGPINFRYNTSKTVTGDTLSALVEEVIIEIKNLKKRQKKIHFKNFTILKKRDVNKCNHTGLFVLKFKDYPFVLKLFIETPEGIIHPNDKGFEPICFYYLSGLSRHFNGGPRIENLERSQHIIQNDPYWSTRVDFPRKWFWLPKDPRWITIEGKNIGTNKEITTTIPGVYACICDEIQWERPFTLKNSADRIKAMNLSNRLGQHIDSHIENFGEEIDKETNDFEEGIDLPKNTIPTHKPKKIVPIDFEDFITAVGIEENLQCKNYFEWYMHLTRKMLKRLLFQNKKERRAAQYKPFKSLI